MTFRTTALAAAIAGAMWCSAPFAQTTQTGQSETSPPTSTTQDMQEPSTQMEESTPSETGSTTAAGAATTGAPWFSNSIGTLLAGFLSLLQQPAR